MRSFFTVAIFLLGTLGYSLALNSWQLPHSDHVWGNIDQSLDADWVVYKKSYNKTYSTLQEEVTRRIYWEDNIKFIYDHNRRYENGDFTYYLGENDFSDLAEDEFEKIFLTGLIVPDAGEEVYPEPLTEPHPEAPVEVDWRKTNLITPVKFQGRCGACWAFAALGSMESLYAKKTGKFVQNFSEQNLLDCAGMRWGNYGCRGGWMNNAFKYMKTSGGVDSEVCYPYTGKVGGCRFSALGKTCVAASLHNYQNVGKSEHSLANDVYKIGPIAVGADVRDRTFAFYRGGVWHDSACNQTDPNHALVAVGYGTSAVGGNYWIVKNSWGKRWGDLGYGFMAKNNGNDCGIKNFASYPLV